MVLFNARGRQGGRVRPSQREAIILSLLINGEKFGREIRDQYQRQTQERMPLGSLYTTLDRMEQKGFVKSKMGSSSPERGGNRRRFYRVTAHGEEALRFISVWGEQLVGGGG